MKSKTKSKPAPKQQFRSRTYQLISPDGHVQSTTIVRVRSRTEVRAYAEEQVASFNRYRPGYSYRIPE